MRCASTIPRPTRKTGRTIARSSCGPTSRSWSTPARRTTRASGKGASRFRITTRSNLLRIRLNALAVLLWAAAGFAQTRPDLSGIWGGDAARAANLGTPAMTPAGEKLFKEHQNGKGDPQKRCLPAGVPRRDARPFKIVQKPDLIVILEEGDIHTFRQIFTDGSDHPADLDPTWYGDSRGRWEGKE